MYGDKRPGSTLLHSCVNVEMHPSRMLQVSRISENLPVFPSKALRASSSSSARFFAGEWLIVVAGNKLFLWKYSRSVNTQPHSSCVSFDLPVSDLPHSASLVGLLFPSNDAEVSPLPTSCLALSSCGGNLRLWPRLTRNYVHVDTVLPAPIGGLYGDQAIQLEHIHVSGAFVAATRTGHLVLIDTRNAQDGVKTHLITSTNDGCMHSKGILSGLGRRVSNFFNLVSSTTNSGLIKSMPARGGENFVFLRLITCMSSNDCEKCFCFALYKNQLDVWSVDYNLNCEWFLSNGERSRVQSLLALLHRSNAVLNATEVHDTTNLNPSNISSSNNSDMMISHQVINNTSIINDKKPLNISVMKNTHHDLNQPHSIVDTSINNSMLGVTSKINQSMQHKVDPISYQRIECDDPVEKFLHRKDVQIHAWPHLMSTGQFEKAATVLYEEASKIIYLTSDQLNSVKNQSKSMFNKNQLINQSYDRMELQKDYEQDNQRCPLISKIDGYLKWISLQELLDQNHVKSESIFDNTSSDSDPRFKRVLSIPVLVRLYVNNAACLNETMKTGGSSGSSSNHNDNNGDREDDDDGDNDNQSNDKHLLSEMIMHFRRAFILIDILQIVSDLRPNDDCHDPIEARDELLLHIWCQAIRMDEWSTSGDVHDPIEICTRSFICALVSDLFKNGVNVISLLPSPDQLFAADELADLTKDPQFHYLIESGFEHMRNILTSQKDTQDIVMTDICGV
uniref:Nucleoporin Nup133/Nup155-like N-terminal domain-containing protein n=1 Tax=Trichobilharzia regenti TaxID=157069 RepID=A0AA85JL73_TRIRE|nr:unnamed protein product [Trichobilharzia regenti]